MANDFHIGSLEHPITDSLATVTVGGERTSLEISKNGFGARVSGDFEVSGNIYGDLKFTDITLDDITCDTVTASGLSHVFGGLTLTDDGTDDYTLSYAENINLDADGGNIRFKDGGTSYFKFDLDSQYMQLFYDDDNYLKIAVVASGATTLTTVDNDGESGHLTLSPNGDTIIDRNIAITDAGSYYGLSIDIDKTGTSTTNNSIYGLKIDADNTTATNGVNTMYGISNTPTLTHAADAGILVVYGLKQTVTSHGNGASLGFGINQVVTGADTSTGIWQTIDDTGIDLKFVSSSNANDYFTLVTGVSAETTLTTVDADSNGAHFNVVADGNIVLDSDNNLNLDAGNLIGLYGGGVQYGIISKGIGNVLKIQTPGANDMLLDSGGDITLDAAGGNITLENAGSTYTPSAGSDATTKTYVDGKRFGVSSALQNSRLSVINTWYTYSQNYGTSIAASDWATNIFNYALYSNTTAVVLKAWVTVCEFSSSTDYELELWDVTVPADGTAEPATVAKVGDTQSISATSTRIYSIGQDDLSFTLAAGHQLYLLKRYTSGSGNKYVYENTTLEFEIA